MISGNIRGRFAHLVFVFPQCPQRVLLLLPTTLQFVVDVAKQLQNLVTLSRIGIVDLCLVGIVDLCLDVQVVLREVEELIG